MSWRVEFRPEVEADVADAALWYEAKQLGFGALFVEGIVPVWHELAANPLIGSRRGVGPDIRWRYPERFPLAAWFPKCAMPRCSLWWRFSTRLVGTSDGRNDVDLCAGTSGRPTDSGELS